MKLPASPARLTADLLAWYDHSRRSLPWREAPTPYRVWVSEIMLQQTQVKTALPFFERFVERFPTIQALATASEDEVLALWSGLGYYSRARNLLRSARLIASQHGGEFPRGRKDVLNLPGIGPYTAGAIRSIAFGEPDPILDGNVRRVAARLLCLEGDIDASATRQLWKLLGDLVQDPAVAPRVSDFNQALMELGALVCRPTAPVCERCPLSGICGARLRGLQEEIPPPRRRRATEEFCFVPLVVRNGELFLMRQNHEESFLKGFWEFPKVAGRPGPDLLERFRRAWNIEILPQQELPSVRHQITFRRLLFFPVVATVASVPRESQWVELDAAEVPTSSYIRKIRDLVK